MMDLHIGWSESIGSTGTTGTRMGGRRVSSGGNSDDGGIEEYTIDSEAYAEALDEELSAIDGEISIDRRGYSEEVAEQLGEDYLQDRILVFSPDQAGLETDYTEYSFIDELLDQVYDREQMLAATDPDSPLDLAVTIDIGQEAFNARATLSNSEFRRYIEQATDLKDEIDSIDIDDLRDGREKLERLTGTAADLNERFDDLRNLTYEDELGVVETDEFSFDTQDLNGHAVYSDNNPLAVLFQGEDVPWEVDGRHSVERSDNELGKLLTGLYRSGSIGVQQQEATDRLKELVVETLRDRGEEVEVNSVDFYQQVIELRDSDELPDEFHAIKPLLRDESVEELVAFQEESETDVLQYLEPQNPKARAILSKAADHLQGDGDDVTILEFKRKHRGGSKSGKYFKGDLKKLANYMKMEYSDPTYQKGNTTAEDIITDQDIYNTKKEKYNKKYLNNQKGKGFIFN